MSRIPNIQPTRLAPASLSAVLSLLEQLVERRVLPVEAAVKVIEQATRDAGPDTMVGFRETQAFLQSEITRLRERFPEAS